jgi:hypothetical protein
MKRFALTDNLEAECMGSPKEMVGDVCFVPEFGRWHTVNADCQVLWVASTGP